MNPREDSFTRAASDHARRQRQNPDLRQSHDEGRRRDKYTFHHEPEGVSQPDSENRKVNDNHKGGKKPSITFANGQGEDPLFQHLNNPSRSGPSEMSELSDSFD